ncbi:Major DNA-binding protein [Heracleum sosnowskyi]|uniref:Major DNA-binding protein n=1 Tax=Heracleum sosnowskyi TaxID=360622 RepID=A0AAD8J1B8_9APIA|nr:Major DNA-binding protein [Heracleum sosnowskyi]
MAKAGVRFKRVADAFDIAARERSPVPESFTDLSDLVDTFIDGEEIKKKECALLDETSDENEGGDYWDNCLDMLRGFLEEKCGEDDHLKLEIQEQVELACCGLGVDRSSPEFKRQLMIRLREKGFDAGLCKAKWGKTAQIQPGEYEYIDVNVAGKRYMVEVSIVSEFELGRSTNGYVSLLEILPSVFVGEVEMLKQIVRLMCRAIKRSMKKYEMHVPPWRRHAYMQAKWFTSNYKRTTSDQFPEKKGYDSDEISEKKRAVGFVPIPVKNRSYFCREACVSKVGSRVGNLAMAMNSRNGLVQL